MQMTTGFLAGQVLLWIGFLGGSMAAVLRLENESSPWETVPWTLYIASAAVGVAGIILLRRDKLAQTAYSASSEIGLEAIQRELAAANESVARLDANLREMSCEEVLDYIDQRCVPHFAEFADGRMVIQNRFGATVYATIMTEFASGERYLNRAWSAAADGYVDEVEASVQHAHTFLQAANAHLRQAVDPELPRGSVVPH